MTTAILKQQISGGNELNVASVAVNGGVLHLVGISDGGVMKDVSCAFAPSAVSAAQAPSTITTAGDGVLTAAKLLGGLITRSGPTAAFTDTTATAALIQASWAGAAGSSFAFSIRNTTAFVQTLAGGVGVTLSAAVQPYSTGVFMAVWDGASLITITLQSCAINHQADDSLLVVDNVSGTAPSTQRLLYGKIVADYAGAVTVASGNGNLTGVRGEMAVGNAATVLGAGYYYGTQGKITSVAGGTLGAGSHSFGVVGQLDMSLGVVSGNPQISAVWGDMGATSPVSGWGTASSILSGQNTTAAAVNSLLYLYGKGTYAMEIDSNGSTVLATAGASNAGNTLKCNANRVLSGIFDGTPGFIPIFNSNS